MSRRLSSIQLNSSVIMPSPAVIRRCEIDFEFIVTCGAQSGSVGRLPPTSRWRAGPLGTGRSVGRQDWAVGHRRGCEWVGRSVNPGWKSKKIPGHSPRALKPWSFIDIFGALFRNRALACDCMKALAARAERRGERASRRPQFPDSFRRDCRVPQLRSGSVGQLSPTATPPDKPTRLGTGRSVGPFRGCMARAGRPAAGRSVGPPRVGNRLARSERSVGRGR